MSETGKDVLVYLAIVGGLVAFFVGLAVYAGRRRKWILWKKAYVAAHPVPPQGAPYTSQHLRMLYDRQIELDRLKREAEERAKKGETIDPKGQVTPIETKKEPPPPPPPPPGTPGTTVGGIPYRRS